MYKDTYACDITKDRKVGELFELIGNFFCDPHRYTSYQIIGLSKDSFICHQDISVYDEDDWFSSTEDGYIDIPFDDKNFIYSLPATEKQKEWLEKHRRNTDISGVEAWHIIHDFVEEAKRKYEQRKYDEEHRWDWIDEDDDAFLCDYFDVPNM